MRKKLRHCADLNHCHLDHSQFQLCHFTTEPLLLLIVEQIFIYLIYFFKDLENLSSECEVGRGGQWGEGLNSEHKISDTATMR